MLLSVHTLTGMAVGHLIGGEVPTGVVFLAGWASHYVLDAIPHSEQPFGKEETIDEKWRIWQYPRRVFFFALSDSLLAAALLLIFCFFTGKLDGPIFWGGVGAMLPDLIDNVPFWSRSTRHTAIIGLQYRWHRFFHVGSWQERWPRYARLLTQAVVAILALWVLL